MELVDGRPEVVAVPPTTARWAARTPAAGAAAAAEQGRARTGEARRGAGRAAAFRWPDKAGVITMTVVLAAVVVMVMLALVAYH
jgi:hypothetical protein